MDILTPILPLPKLSAEILTSVLNFLTCMEDSAVYTHNKSLVTQNIHPSTRACLWVPYFSQCMSFYINNTKEVFIDGCPHPNWHSTGTPLNNSKPPKTRRVFLSSKKGPHSAYSAWSSGAVPPQPLGILDHFPGDRPRSGHRAASLCV